MSDAIFPSNLPGLKWDVVRTDAFKTSIYESLSGAERRIRHRTIPKRRIELSFEVLREQGQWDELKLLQSFYLDRSGSFDSFLFHDPFDGQANNLQFGTGDGVTTQFQLFRLIAGRQEVVHNPASTIVVGRSWFPPTWESTPYWPQPSGMWPGDAETGNAGGWSLLPNGIVNFAVAPPTGVGLIWTGSFYYRARFADDNFSTTEFMQRMFSLNSLPLIMSLQNIL